MLRGVTGALVWNSINFVYYLEQAQFPLFVWSRKIKVNVRINGSFQVILFFVCSKLRQLEVWTEKLK